MNCVGEASSVVCAAKPDWSFHAYAPNVRELFVRPPNCGGTSPCYFPVEPEPDSHAIGSANELPMPPYLRAL